jgi:Cof subfamily protein (haloacid dehalogenase superfamily)
VTIRLLAFDYDGTAAIGGELPTAKMVAAVAAAQTAGVRVVLATGRSYSSALPYAQALGLHDPIICYQGAMIRGMGPRPHTLLTEPLPEGPLADVCAYADAAGLDLNLYGEDEMFFVRMGYPQSFYDKWFSMPMRKVESYAQASRILAQQGERPLKGLFIGQPDDHDRLMPDLEARFGDRLSVVRSHDLFAEVVSPGASKGNALAYLARQWGIGRDQTMAAGDSGNDVSMVRWAGLGVAMHNATPDVHEVADLIAPPVTQDGLVAVIEEHVLSNGRG